MHLAYVVGLQQGRAADGAAIGEQAKEAATRDAAVAHARRALEELRAEGEAWQAEAEQVEAWLAERIR